MIQEIKNFVEHISQNDEEVFSRNLKLKEGIYILLDIQKQKDEYVLVNESEIFETKKDIFVFNGKNQTENQILYKKFLSLQINSTVVGNGKNKSLNSSSGIFMFTANPFAIALKKERYNLKIQDSVIAYFKAAQNYVEDQTHIDWLDSFKGFCESKLLQLIPQITEFEELNKKQLIYFFLKEPTINDFATVHQAYLSEKVFNKDKFNVKIEDTTFGISDSLSGFNDKKMFLKHYTSPLEYNYRIEGDVAMQLWRFFELQKNKQIPNPIPIFIDKKEFNYNEKMISIFSEDNKIGHAALIKSILKESSTQSLQNYYLIYFGGTKGSRIADIDFVSQFKYKEKNAEIIEVFPLGGKQSSKKIEHVFDLENHVFNRIFNGQLKTDTWLKYFGELEYNPKYMTDTVYNQLLRYRQAIYNFIYKSQRQAITSSIFDDLMEKGILDDIRNDEYKDKKHSHEYAIKEKLNIWFSLYNFFIHSKQRQNMVNRTQELLEYLPQLSKSESNEHLKDDDTFAFAVGQIVHYLLNQSEAGNRTHALLEPFLQKSDVNQLKLAIARTFDMYKHALRFYKRKYEFDKLMSEVMGYTPNETNMKNLLPLLLAGYFSKSIFSKDKDNTESN